jgi:hypothetical protein
MLTASHLITKATAVLIIKAEQLLPLNHDCGEGGVLIGRWVLEVRLDLDLQSI